jgi:threonylcarbamoyladenosine tRNA methylthiotransferase MtaB
MQKNSFKIYTLGCKVNQYDSNSLATKLQAAGFVMKKNDADLAIINTCAVTKSALRKGRQMINRARRENPGAKIAIVGCAVKIYKEEVGKWGADFILDDKDSDKIIKNVKRFFPEIATSRPGGTRNDKQGKSRYFLKIQDGCRQFCSYCIIPYARGPLTSRPENEVITEARQIVAQGFKEIILCGIHLGLYGVDFEHTSPQPSPDKREGIIASRRNLVSLLRGLVKVDGLERIRLSSIEVNEVTDELLAFMKKNKKLCRHLHIPLQAGCDKILKLMNRPYTTARFADKIKKLRKIMPEIGITTDVIVGFPGETEKDFQKTVEFIKKMNFSKIHVFSFSAHERTPAAKLPDHINEAIKAERSARLQKLSAKLQSAYRKKFKGKKLGVIIDGRSQEGHYRGKTEYYFDIEFNSKKKYRQGESVIAQA